MNNVHKISVKKLENLSQQIKGLMFAIKIHPIYFETRFGIHTFFVKKPIDVLVTDVNNIVKVLKNNLRPNSIFIWNPKYFRVLELPAGYIEINNIKIGSMVRLHFI